MLGRDQIQMTVSGIVAIPMVKDQGLDLIQMQKKRNVLNKADRVIGGFLKKLLTNAYVRRVLKQKL